MRLCKPSFEIWNQPAGLEGVYRQIERAGRVSHKSEDRITEDSAKTFVERMKEMKHLSTCEFGTVYLQFFWSGAVCQCCNQTIPNKLLDKYADNKYSIVNYHGNDIYVTTNLRVLIENNWLDDLKYLCEPTEYHHKRYTVKFILDRAILAEFTRHRRFSFMAESTRYCNYSKNKFNNELTFIKPCWTNIPEGNYGDVFNPKEPDITLTPNEYAFIDILRETEKYYIGLTNNGWKAEQARGVLPLSLKTELYMCGFTEDWEKFFELRCAANSHPQARELAIPLSDEFIKRGYINSENLENVKEETK